MAFVKLWAGKAYGTNTGNLFVKLEGEDKALKGTLHHNDPDVGLSIYDVAGSFDGNTLSLVGKPQKPAEGMPTKVKAIAHLLSNGTMEGQWGTDIGSAGTFQLFPHERPPSPSPAFPSTGPSALPAWATSTGSTCSTRPRQSWRPRS